MFRSVEMALISLYVMGVAMIVSGMYWILEIVNFEQWGVIALSALLIAIPLGMIAAKIAIYPLREYFTYLDRFSKETLHELNLPINTITANLEMLRKAHTDEKSLKRLERIEMATQMLRTRYDELDYVIKKQMEREHIETFDVGALIEERVSFLRELYPQAQWEVQTQSYMVILDRIGLAKVIDNIVDNGVKYASTSARISIEQEGGRISLSDNGRGMDELTIMRIFDRYYQGEPFSSGYGIGLSLVKRYCDRYRIGLSVNSHIGEGTRITLEIPRGNNGK